MDPAACSPPADEVRDQLARMLSSGAFARSKRQRRFLHHVVDATLDGSPGSLKEAELGMTVFDRGEAFDPRSDNIVRVEARRLRRRLEDYYAHEGAQDPILIEFPAGAYVAQFSTRTPTDSASAPPPRRSIRGWAILVAGALVGAAGVAFWLYPRQPVSIAVLPFADFSASGDDRYRADGIAEDIMQALARTRRLRVVARTSAFQFRGGPLDTREIGRRLRTGLLVEGSLQNRDGHLRITARLVKAEEGFEVWSGTEEADSGGVENAERVLVAGIAKTLNLSPPPSGPRHNPPAEVLDLALHARYLAGRGGDENRSKAVELYRRATSIDPDYARAWGELANALSLTAFHDSAAAPALTPRIQAAANRAIGLDDSFPDPHVALARLAWAIQWDWSTAERQWRRALEIDPNHANARVSYALALASRRRYRESIAEARRAMDLDPLSFAASNDLGVLLYAAGRFEEAAGHARRCLSVAPDAQPPHFLLGVALAAKGRYAEAIEELQKVAGATGRPSAVLGRLGNAYARAGRRAEAEAIVAEQTRAPNPGWIYVAMVETGLGHREAALTALDKSAQLRDTDFLFIGTEPVFDSLRGDSRFAQSCAKLGLAAR